MDYKNTKNSTCTIGLVAQLCRNWLSRGRQPEFPLGEIPLGQYSCKSKNNQKTKQNIGPEKLQHGGRTVLFLIAGGQRVDVKTER